MSDNMWFTENAFVDFEKKEVRFSDGESKDSKPFPGDNVEQLLRYLAMEYKTKKWFSAQELKSAIWGERNESTEYDNNNLAQEIKKARELLRCTKDSFLIYDRGQNAYRFNPPDDKPDPVEEWELKEFPEDSQYKTNALYREKKRHEYEIWLDEHEKTREHEKDCIVKFVTSKYISSIIMRFACVIIINILLYHILSSWFSQSSFYDFLFGRNNLYRYDFCITISSFIFLLDYMRRDINRDIVNVIIKYDWISELRKMYNNSRFEIIRSVESRVRKLVLLILCAVFFCSMIMSIMSLMG